MLVKSNLVNVLLNKSLFEATSQGNAYFILNLLPTSFDVNKNIGTTEPSNAVFVPSILKLFKFSNVFAPEPLFVLPNTVFAYLFNEPYLGPP